MPAVLGAHWGTLSDLLCPDTVDSSGFPAFLTISTTFPCARRASCNFHNSGDRNNTNPMLKPLQNNGGPTQTMALPSGSPAIDAGNPSGVSDAPPSRSAQVGCVLRGASDTAL